MRFLPSTSDSVVPMFAPISNLQRKNQAILLVLIEASQVAEDNNFLEIHRNSKLTAVAAFMAWKKKAEIDRKNLTKKPLPVRLFCFYKFCRLSS